jgi:hypothetical protein
MWLSAELMQCNRTPHSQSLYKSQLCCQQYIISRVLSFDRSSGISTEFSSKAFVKMQGNHLVALRKTDGQG